VIVPLCADGTGYAGVNVAGDSLVGRRLPTRRDRHRQRVGRRARQFRDSELFNRPGKGDRLPYSFFAMHCATAGRASVTRILEGPIPPPHESPQGHYSSDLAGLPRMASATMRGFYPFVEVRLNDPACPVEVTIEGQAAAS
jgi:hypothetical protein